MLENLCCKLFWHIRDDYISNWIDKPKIDVMVFCRRCGEVIEWKYENI